jgi:hypothetical protein
MSVSEKNQNAHVEAIAKRENAVALFFEALAQLVVVATHAVKDEVLRKSKMGRV